MKFVTREKPKVDRVACPWLIRRFIDASAHIFFVPTDEVLTTAEREEALPFDIPDVELGHHDGGSSFEAFIRKFNLTDPALLELAKIVRAADTTDRASAPEGEGLRQIANGWHLLDWTLDKRLEFGFGVYDCLYAVCQQRVREHKAETVLFFCPHNAAKSVIAAVYFNRFARERGLSYHAISAGTEPSPTVSPAVVTMLKAEGFDVSNHIPRRFNTSDIESAGRIISMGCSAEELSVRPEAVEFWLDVPMVSQQPEEARRAIYRHVETLIGQLEGGE